VYERRQLNSVWSSWVPSGGFQSLNQVVTHTNQLSGAGTPGARATVRVAVANGGYENVGLIFDSTTGKWEAETPYYSDVSPQLNASGWTNVGLGRRFPWQPFANAGLKPQVRALCQANDISNDQNGAELRVWAAGDAVHRGSGIQTGQGITQVAYDGRYGISYQGWAALDTGWCDVTPAVAVKAALVFNPQVATNDGNGRQATFYATQLMLRWTAV
jgi:hypothetical protein